jgi:thioredoxin-dependent peroxiredoxin
VINLGVRLDVSFRVKAVIGGTVKEVRFGDLLTRRTLVSVFMKSKTPTCDRQNESLAASAAEFERAGYNLIAISRDTAGSLLRYAAARNLPYTLVSDPHDQFARAAASLVEKSMYGRKFIGPARAAYALDGDGTVLAIVEKVDAAAHAAQLHAAIKSL